MHSFSKYYLHGRHQEIKVTATEPAESSSSQIKTDSIEQAPLPPCTVEELKDEIDFLFSFNDFKFCFFIMILFLINNYRNKTTNKLIASQLKQMTIP